MMRIYHVKFYFFTNNTIIAYSNIDTLLLPSSKIYPALYSYLKVRMLIKMYLLRKYKIYNNKYSSHLDMKLLLCKELGIIIKVTIYYNVHLTFTSRPVSNPRETDFMICRDHNMFECSFKTRFAGISSHTARLHGDLKMFRHKIIVENDVDVHDLLSLCRGLSSFEAVCRIQ